MKEAHDEEIDELKKYARFWRIEKDCSQAQEKIANYAPPKLQEHDYALVAEAGGQKIRKFAAYDAGSTKTAARALYENRHRYPYAWRKKAAARLLARAEKFAAHIPDYLNTYLHKAAGFGYPTEETIEQTLLERLNLAKEAAYTDEKQKLAEVLSKMAEDATLRFDEDFIKAAMEAIEHFDAETGLTAKYGSEIGLPEDLIASGRTTEKLSKLASYKYAEAKLVNGKSIDVTQVQKEALAAVDPGLVDLDAGELASVLPTLPRGDADLLVRLSE